MTAYYNEYDKYAAAWLRNLIAAGLIAPGIVDDRSIEDVRPDDLRGFTQCHFFAGIGVWSYALRLAGWPDDKPVWTMSCPCQPFSAAGQGNGFADERHLWPVAHHLIQERRPAIIIGEQVASKDADPWIDLVQDDMEALDYTFGAVPFPSAGVGAPHIRDRLYWMAHAANSGLERRRSGGASDGRDAARVEPERLCDAGGLGHHHHQGLEGLRSGHQAEGGHGQGSLRPAAATGESGRLADAHGRDSGAERQQCSGEQRQQLEDGSSMRLVDSGRGELGLAGSGPTNGFWQDADWLRCRDGKWRPVEPGTFPLVYGAAARVGRLRAYGNAINAEAAKAFIECVMEFAP